MNIQTKQPEMNLAGVHSVRLDPENDSFSLHDLLRIVRLRRAIFLATAILVYVLAATVLSRLTPLYTATSLVMLDQRKNNVIDVTAVLSGLPTDPSSVENQVQVLRSRTLAARVAEKLKLESDPVFNAPLRSERGIWAYVDTIASGPLRWLSYRSSSRPEVTQPRNDTNAIINRLHQRLSVTPQGRSTAIELRFQSEDPARAALIVNAFADAYVEDQLNAKFEATQNTTTWLAARVQELAQQQRNADTALEQYKLQNKLSEINNGTSIIEQQITALNAQLILARSNLAEQEAKLARVVELERSGRNADVTSVVASSLIGQLRQQETELLRRAAELSSRYGPLHPRKVELESERKDLAAKIDQEVNRVVQTSTNEVSVARARVGSLQSSLADLERRLQTDNQARIRLRGLEASATSVRSLHETFLSRLKETQGQQDIQTPDARVISRAPVPETPTYPNQVLAYAMVIPGGLLLGLILALLAEKLNAGFRTAVEAERHLGLPVLAVIPEVTGLLVSARSVAARIVDKPISAFTEGFRSLDIGVVLSDADRPRVVLVTSAVSGEGKTTVAVGLARLAAEHGQRAVIVDADLRQPTVARTLGIVSKGGGTAAVLAGVKRMDECLVRDTYSSLLCLPAVRSNIHSPNLLRSAHFQHLISDLKRTFDVVIIDSTPLLAVNDAKVIALLADTTVLVVQWERTPRAAALSAARTLLDLKVPIAGVALSRTHWKRYQYYSYGYRNQRNHNRYYIN